jgi:hypothetical protein
LGTNAIGHATPGDDETVPDRKSLFINGDF